VERAEKKQNFRTQQIQLRIKQKEERIRNIEEQRRQQLLQQKKKLQRELFTRQKILESKVPQPSADVVEKKLVSLLGPGAGAKVCSACADACAVWCECSVGHVWLARHVRGAGAVSLSVIVVLSLWWDHSLWAWRIAAAPVVGPCRRSL
jgi:hypothetical protein